MQLAAQFDCCKYQESMVIHLATSAKKSSHINYTPETAVLTCVAKPWGSCWARITL